MCKGNTFFFFFLFFFLPGNLKAQLRAPTCLMPELEAHTSLFPCQELLYARKKKLAQGNCIVKTEYVDYKGI